MSQSDVAFVITTLIFLFLAGRHLWITRKKGCKHVWTLKDDYDEWKANDQDGDISYWKECQKCNETRVQQTRY